MDKEKCCKWCGSYSRIQRVDGKRVGWCSIKKTYCPKKRTKEGELALCDQFHWRKND